jgi:hypothetical protein
VELLFQGSKNVRAGGAAFAGDIGWGEAARMGVEVTCDEAGTKDLLLALLLLCEDRGMPDWTLDMVGGLLRSPATRHR